VPEAEEALMSVINTDCPVRRFGFFGDEGGGVFSLSCNEELSIWHAPSAIRVADVPAAREALEADYLIDCFYSPEDGVLELLAGTHSGGLVLASVRPRPKKGGGLGGRGKLRVEVSYSGFASAGGAGQHQATVRCSALASSSSSSSEGGGGAMAFLTGAEDGSVVSWVRPRAASAPDVEGSDDKEEEEGDCDEARRERKRERKREEKRERKRAKGTKRRKTEEE
jgi:hypothetical protein